ncbi:ECF RNA polymerase sigma factor SigW [bioreactor metagenome]|uniref:ECF RNA polymerase sigma factor SigW n=1 Tax=bioreactor metagenome TaxID=1076179 RepID=A0A645AQU6_9ZZZZ|nr:RNA polymerase sigma-70 factor [Petrimonas sp.]
MPNEVKELIALKNGSHKAFEAIYNRYAGKLYNFIMTISHGDKYMSEEVVQSAFVRLWEIKERIDVEKSILSYLSTISKNLLFNKYQRQTIEFLYQKFMINEQESYHPQTENEIDRKWLEDFVNELIEQLPPARKKIFILRKKENFSTKEIAEAMNISVSTVETQLSLATKFMRKQFEKNYNKLFGLMLLLLI